MNFIDVEGKSMKGADQLHCSLQKRTKIGKKEMMGTLREAKYSFRQELLSLYT